MRTIPFLSVFFPAFNEAESLPTVLSEAVAVLGQFADRFEIIVVDDGSSDATAQIASEFGSPVRVVAHETNSGYGAAVRTGFLAAKGDAVFFTDADHQFRLSDLGSLVECWAPNTAVIGYRKTRNDPKIRLVIARVYKMVLRVVFRLRITDVDCAFKLLDRTVVDNVAPNLESKSAFISPELMIRTMKSGASIVEVGVVHYPRLAGKPKGATPKVIARTIKEIVRMRHLGRRPR